MKNTSLTKTFIAIALGAAVTVPAAIADSLSPAQIADERQNLYSDGSLPFIHSPVLYGSGSDVKVIWTDERIDEFKNLHSDGSLPFVHSPDAFGTGVANSDAVWTDAYIAEFRNLHSDGSLL